MQKETVITVGTRAAQWLDERYNRWSVHTQKGYRNLVEHHIVPSIGRASLRKLNVHRIDGFYKALAGKGLGAQSISDRKQALFDCVGSRIAQKIHFAIWRILGTAFACTREIIVLCCI